jgi:Domain of unknown function (DUF4389)
MTSGTPHAGRSWEAGALGVTPYPIELDGRFDPTPNRWLWLVKWLLAVPHYVVLAFLWVGVILTTLVAFFAVLLTKRYPRALFDYNAGVLRWTWRVTFYVLPVGTTEYPSFGLKVQQGDPAVLAVEYPEDMSRWLVLVKWLFAIPQFIVAHILRGLAVVLAVIGGFILLFTGRNPRDIFDIVVGASRWSFRVTAYALLMRDEYPPFRFTP